MQGEPGSESSAAESAPDVGKGPGDGPAPGVALLAAATQQTVNVAAAVAAGVSESLHLGIEATASLNAIAVEGSRNVVAHAYPRGRVGPLWMRIEPPAAGVTENREVNVSFRDSGRGCSFWPTSSNPPGMGIALICELSERTRITSRRGVGTGMDASVNVGDDFDPATPLPANDAPPEASELLFEGPALMESVLPRALGAHLEGPGATVDQLVDASRLGAAIAGGLAERDASAPVISLADRPEGVDAPLLVKVGPISPGEADRLIESLDSAWDGRPGSLAMTTEIEGADHARACISLDVAGR